MNDAKGIPLNCGFLSGPTSYIFKKPSMGGDLFRLIANPIIRTVTAGISGIITQNDVVFFQNSSSNTITDYQLIVEQLVPGTYNISIQSNNTGVLSNPNASLIASGISSGSSLLTAMCSNGTFSTVNVIVNQTSATTSINFIEYVTSSLSKHISETLDNRINNLNAEVAKPIFSTQNHSTATYIRNPACWASNLDLTCISPWNSTGGAGQAGTLISPRHVIFCKHANFHPSIGASMRFVTSNNTVITRQVTNLLTHPQYSPFYPDIVIGLLDSDVPETISFAKILPQNWNTYLPSLSNIYTLPCLALDQEEKALISELYRLTTTAACLTPNKPNRLAFFENIITGDSGNPLFLIINNQLVIITVWTYGNAGSGTNIAYHKDAINTMMNSLGGGYQLTEIDLSAFPTYM